MYGRRAPLIWRFPGGVTFLPGGRCRVAVISSYGPGILRVGPEPLRAT